MIDRVYRTIFNRKDTFVTKLKSIEVSEKKHRNIYLHDFVFHFSNFKQY